MEKHKGALRGRLNLFAGTLFLLVFSVAAGLALSATNALAQEAGAVGSGGSEVKLMQPSTAGQAGAPITITFQDALDRARKNDPTFIASALDAKERA